MMGISVWQLLIVLAIVVLLFGTRRLRSFGSDFGESIRGFRRAVRKEDNGDLPHDTDKQADTRLVHDKGQQVQGLGSTKP